MRLTSEKTRQLILALILTFGALGVLWYLLVQRLVSIRARDQREVGNLAGKITAQEKAIQNEINNRNSAQVYKDFIASWDKQLPHENVETWLVREVSQVASRHGLQIVNTVMQAPREGLSIKFRNQPYQVVGFVFEVEGEFNQVGLFLQDLENSMPLAEVDEMEFAAGTGTARHIHKASVRLTMVTR